MADDFADMLKFHLVAHLVDLKICNPAMKGGKPDPHSVFGYLAHPKIARIVGEWLFTQAWIACATGG